MYSSALSIKPTPIYTNCQIDQPTEDPNIRGDAFKTLIVARLSYDATEQDVEREFGRFGPIERVSSRHVLHRSYTDIFRHASL